MLANIFLISHISIIINIFSYISIILEKKLWNEKLGKYFPYCTRHHVIATNNTSNENKNDK